DLDLADHRWRRCLRGDAAGARHPRRVRRRCHDGRLLDRHRHDDLEPVDDEVDRDRERQRVRADHVLDHLVGDLERQRARIDRCEAVLGQRRRLEQATPAPVVLATPPNRARAPRSWVTHGGTSGSPVAAASASMPRAASTTAAIRAWSARLVWRVPQAAIAARDASAIAVSAASTAARFASRRCATWVISMRVSAASPVKNGIIVSEGGDSRATRPLLPGGRLYEITPPWIAAAMSAPEPPVHGGGWAITGSEPR